MGEAWLNEGTQRRSQPRELNSSAPQLSHWKVLFTQQPRRGDHLRSVIDTQEPDKDVNA